MLSLPWGLVRWERLRWAARRWEARQEDLSPLLVFVFVSRYLISLGQKRFVTYVYASCRYGVIT